MLEQRSQVFTISDIVSLRTGFFMVPLLSELEEKCSILTCSFSMTIVFNFWEFVKLMKILGKRRTVRTFPKHSLPVFSYDFSCPRKFEELDQAENDKLIYQIAIPRYQSFHLLSAKTHSIIAKLFHTSNISFGTVVSVKSFTVKKIYSQKHQRQKQHRY